MACGSPDAPPRDLPGPNVVLIVADDLGWGDVGYHGSEIDTPNLDALARNGVQLDRFYTAPICTPTRAAIVTGRSPIHFGLNSVVRPWTRHGLSASEYTIGERFRDAGYQTAFVGKWHLGHYRSEYFPNLQGFDRFYGTLIGFISYFTHTNFDQYRFLDWIRDGRDVVERGYATTLLGAEAVRFIEERDRTTPFFLLLAFNAPHQPKHATLLLRAKYALKGLSGERRNHAAQVDAMDRSIGGVMETLASEGIDRDTVVMFLSDNGARLNQGGDNGPFRGEKGTTLEGGIRVPALLRWTGTLPEGGTSTQRMRDRDVFPTLEAAAGLARRAPRGSLDAWPILLGAREQQREPFFFRVDVANPGTAQANRAVIDGKWKLLTRDQSASGGRRYFDLYDIEADPGEEDDMAKRFPAIVEDLEKKLAAWEDLYPPDGLRRSSAPPAGWKPPSDSILELIEDPEVLEAALGSP